MDARAEAQYVMSLDEPSRQRSMRLDDEAKQRERIHQMNDRLKKTSRAPATARLDQAPTFTALVSRPRRG